MQRRVPHIHERFLRHIWNHQYLRNTTLATTLGLPVTVLHPGTFNSGSGPDFLDARIIIGTTTFAGDVEIHRTAIEWLQHHHHDDPRYNRVILHVVLEEGSGAGGTFTQSGRPVPVLVIEKFLSESLRAIWQRSILDERQERDLIIPCASRNADVSVDLLSGWLEKLGVERLELKLRRFDERLRQFAQEELLTLHEPWRRYGELPIQGFPEEIPPPSLEPTPADLSKRHLWDQLLYEGLMDALGFSRNRDPFTRLAQALPLTKIRESGALQNRLSLEALLFGAAALLPPHTSNADPPTRRYLRTLQEHWRNLRSSISFVGLHRADWVFSPTRPSNFPTVRLAAAAAYVEAIIGHDLFRRVIQSFKQGTDPVALQEALLDGLRVEVSEFWAHHYTFEQSSARPISAVGKARLRDIIVNTLLPMALLYARIFHERVIRENALRLYGWSPPLSDNAIVRTMAEQLVRERIPISSVQTQQGLIQLYKYYCVEGRCGECEIGKIVFRSSA